MTNTDYKPPKLDDVFFYDRDLLNRNLTVRLIDWDEKKLIARSIIGQNYGYNITNSWGTEGTVIDTAINWIGSRVTGPSGKIANEIAGVVSDNGLKITDIFGDNKITKGINDIASHLASNKYGNLVNSKIWSIGETIKTFNGTNVDINGLDKITLKFIHDKNGNDVISQVNRLNKYAIGGEFIDENLEQDVKNAIGIEMGSLLSIQKAPNDYKFTGYNIARENRIERTITAFIGNFMIIENLLINNMNVNFSSVKVMDEDNPIDIYKDESGKFCKGKLSSKPLYATVDLSFTYAKLITLGDLTKILNSEVKQYEDQIKYD